MPSACSSRTACGTWRSMNGWAARRRCWSFRASRRRCRRNAAPACVPCRSDAAGVAARLWPGRGLEARLARQVARVGALAGVLGAQVRADVEPHARLVVQGALVTLAFQLALEALAIGFVFGTDGHVALQERFLIFLIY